MPKISELPVGVTLVGDELFPVTQVDDTIQVPLSEIATFIGAAAHTHEDYDTSDEVDDKISAATDDLVTEISDEEQARLAHEGSNSGHPNMVVRFVQYGPGNPDLSTFMPRPAGIPNGLAEYMLHDDPVAGGLDSLDHDPIIKAIPEAW